MEGRDNIVLALALIARNPGVLLILIPASICLVPLAFVFLAFYLLIKVLEKAQVAHRRREQAQLETPQIPLIKGAKW